MHSSLDERRYLIPFRASLLPQIFTETLVIGGGVAGLRAGIAAAERGDVVILAKGKLEVSNTDWAQGGVAVVMDSADSVEEHVRDTLEAGDGLCNERAVRDIVSNAPPCIQDLIDLGVAFSRLDDGRPRPPMWITAGGRVEDGESLEQAALREGFEETGLTGITLGPVVWYSEFPLRQGDVTRQITEQYVWARADSDALSDAHWEEVERPVIKDMRWWTADALKASEEIILPPSLPDLFPKLLKGPLPKTPQPVPLKL